MSSIEEPDRWHPDTALVFTVRTRSLPIADLSGPDRAWIVASLTVEGWTVAAIADRLVCSLRLIQQIKAEPMTIVALYALGLERKLREEKGLRHLEGRLADQDSAAKDQRIHTLERQRDRMLDQIVRQQKETRNGA